MPGTAYTTPIGNGKRLSVAIGTTMTLLETARTSNALLTMKLLRPKL